MHGCGLAACDARTICHAQMKWFYSTRALALFWIFTCSIAVSGLVKGEYIVEVRTHNFSNPGSLRSNGFCCDSCFNAPGCDNYFYYCLRALGSTEDGCNGGRTSMVGFDDRPLNFSQPVVLGLPNPLPLPGLTTEWNGVQVYVEVFDYDGPNNRDDFVGRVVHDIPQNMTVGVESEPILYRHEESDRSSIALSFRVVCSPGFTGGQCEVNIDDCQGMESPCNGSGQCVDGVNDFVCECDSGFTGEHCEVNVNECETMNITCSGHGLCLDDINSYSCICDSGFTGTSCNEGPSSGDQSQQLQLIGGVVGGLVVAVLILIIVFVILIVLLKLVHPRKSSSVDRAIDGSRAGDNPVYGLRSEQGGETALTSLPEGSAQTEYVDVLPSPSEELEHKFDNPIYTSIKNTGPSELSAGFEATSTAASAPLPRLDSTPANANGSTYQVIESSGTAGAGDNGDRAVGSVEHEVNNPLYGSGNDMTCHQK